MAILLLSTEACHLCELAQVELQKAFSLPNIQTLSHKHSFEIYLQDIIDQPKWLALYAEKIPVLLDEGSDLILEWPFDANGIAVWLEKVASYTGSESC